MYNKDGDQEWQWFDWKSFIGEHFHKLKGIRKYRHFRFTSSEPGLVFLKTSPDALESSYILIKSRSVFDRHSMPTVIPPAGMSQDRQNYLYRCVRPYVRPSCQDSLCPRPPDEE